MSSIEKMGQVMEELHPKLVEGTTPDDLADALLKKLKEHNLSVKEAILIAFFLGTTGTKVEDEE